MSIFTRLNEMLQRDVKDQHLNSRERESLGFLIEKHFKYEEPSDMAFYKIPFEKTQDYNFDCFVRMSHYELICNGHTYETGMKNGADFKPYILVFYNKRNGVEGGNYIELIDRKNKTKSTDIEIVFTLSGDDLLMNDYGVYYNGQVIPLHQVNIICQYYNMRHQATLSNKVFYDDNKITFSSIVMSRIATNNGLITKQINKRIVMNIETGKTYKLNDFDLIAKKKCNLKFSPFMCLSAWLLRQTPYGCEVDIDGKDFYKIGETIQEKAGEDAIPFAKYEKDANIRNVHNRLRLLVAYNTNPYVSYSILENMYMVKDDAKLEKNNHNKCFNKKFNCKVLRNKNVVNEMMSFLTSEGYNKKFINLKLSGFNSCSFAYDKDNYDRILNMSTIQDKNNKWKIVEAYFKNNYSLHSLEGFFGTKIFKDLVAEHKENNVINAVVKIQDSYELSSMARSYDYIKDLMPNYTLPKRLRLKEIYDTLDKDYKKLKNNAFEYHYNQELQNQLNKEIDGFKFTLATTSEELVEVGSKMNICVGGYTSNVARKECMIVYVTKEDKYVGCIEITPEGEINQAKAVHNNYFEDELLAAFNEYAEMLKLDTHSCYDLRSDNKKVRKTDIDFKLNELEVVVKVPTVVDNSIEYKSMTYEEYRNRNGSRYAPWNADF